MPTSESLRLRRRRRTPLRLILIAGVLTIAGCAGSVTPQESATQESPVSSSETSQAPSASRSSATGEVKEGVVYASGPGHQLDLYYPAQQAAGAAPLVVFIHGGGWMNGDRSMLADGAGNGLDAWRGWLNKHGYVVASVDYRLSAVAAFPAQIQDVKASIRYLRDQATQLGIDGARVAVIGESAGGHLAELVGLTAGDATMGGHVEPAGTDQPVSAVVSYYGVSDLAHLVSDREAQHCPPEASGAGSPEGKLLGGKDPVTTGRAAATAASPVAHVKAGGPPFLFFHGRQDCIVPHVQTQRLAALLKKKGNTVEATYIDAGHASAKFYTTPALLDQLVAFLGAHL